MNTANQFKINYTVIFESNNDICEEIIWGKSAKDVIEHLIEFYPKEVSININKINDINYSDFLKNSTINAV